MCSYWIQKDNDVRKDLTDIIRIVYSKESERFQLTDTSNMVEYIPLEDVAFLRISILELLISFSSYTEKLVKHMSSLEYNAERREVTLYYNYSQTKNAKLDLPLHEIQYFNGAF